MSVAASTSKAVFRSAGDVARHVLRTQGVKTTQELFEACMIVPARTRVPYVGPAQRDYRYTDGRALDPAKQQPHSDHLVRSMRHLKMTLRELEHQGHVGHATIQKWIQLIQKAKNDDAVLQAAQEKAIHLKTSKSSPFVWIDGDLWHGKLRDNK